MGHDCELLGHHEAQDCGGDGEDHHDDEAATCNFHALMEAVAQALRDDDPSVLASSDVYLACASVATQIADTRIATCKPPSLHLLHFPANLRR